MLDVIEVVLHFFECIFNARAVGITDLGPSGDARLDYVTLSVEGDLVRQLLHEGGPLRSRSDETHVPAQDIPQLRDLIQARLAHEAPNGRNPRIVVAGTPYRTRPRFGISTHGSELVNREAGAVQPHALLVVEDGIERRIEFHEQR